MKHMFSPNGEAALRAFVRTDTLIALDYDGTLSPIVPHPERARTAAGIARPLCMLDELATVAIVTGRRISDIRQRLQFSPRFLIGNHGLEGLPDQDGLPEGARLQCRAWLDQLGTAPAMESVLPGILVEDKSLSISIHYRLARDRKQARDVIAKRLESLSPAPRVIGGHYVVNLLPAEAPDKGAALKHLLKLSGCRNTLYVGDDEADETVFRKAPPDWLTVRVGYRPDSAAAYFLHQSEVAPLLNRIVAVLQTERIDRQRIEGREVRG